MKLDRKQACLKKMTKEDDSFVRMSPSKRISLMWDITAELWSLSGYNVKQRLQRNVTKLIKNKLATGRKKDELDAEYLKEGKS